MSLTTCLRKAGKAINPQDKAEILARAREYRVAGMSVALASAAAVDAQIAYVTGQVDALLRVGPGRKPAPSEPQEAPSADDSPPERIVTSDEPSKPVQRQPAVAVEPAEAAQEATERPDGDPGPDEDALGPQGDKDPPGSTPDDLRAALRLRFGDLVSRMERKGLLCIDDEADPEEQGDGVVCLAPSEVSPGQEVAAFLHACSGDAGLQAMLGEKVYAKAQALVEALVAEDDLVAVKGEARVPDNARPANLDDWMLACTVQAAAEQASRPLMLSDDARLLLVAVVPAVRAWWAGAPVNMELKRYGQEIQLSPQDIGALVVYAMGCD